MVGGIVFYKHIFQFRIKFHKLLSDFPDYEFIFTVGSKDNATVGPLLVLFHLTYIIVDHLTMPFFQRK